MARCLSFLSEPLRHAVFHRQASDEPATQLQGQTRSGADLKVSVFSCVFKHPSHTFDLEVHQNQRLQCIAVWKTFCCLSNRIQAAVTEFHGLGG